MSQLVPGAVVAITLPDSVLLSRREVTLATPAGSNSIMPSPSTEVPTVEELIRDSKKTANGIGAVARQKAGELVAGPGTSDSTVSPIGPPSRGQSEVLKHVDGLSRALAGVSKSAERTKVVIAYRRIHDATEVVPAELCA